jgi:hypothetical protein
MKLPTQAPEASPRRAVILSRADSEGSRPSVASGQTLEEVWERHGRSAYALACALLGNEPAAAETVRRSMIALSHSTREGSIEDARLGLMHHVYRLSEQPGPVTSCAAPLPPLMVWVSQLARLQRASLALCVFGGLTHREAADLLDVPPRTVADLITAGLRELGRFTAAATPTCA